MLPNDGKMPEWQLRSLLTVYHGVASSARAPSVLASGECFAEGLRIHALASNHVIKRGISSASRFPTPCKQFNGSSTSPLILCILVLRSDHQVSSRQGSSYSCHLFLKFGKLPWLFPLTISNE